MLHLMIGSVYAWSVYTKPIAAQTGWSESSVAFAFSLAISFLVQREFAKLTDLADELD